MKKQFLLVLLAAFLGLGSKGLACQASFTWFADSTGGVQFTNTSSGVFAGNYQWSFGDGTGSAQANPFHQYNASNWFLVCLTVWDSIGCQSTFCDTVLSGQTATGCQAFFTWSSTSANNIVNFNNQSFGNYIGGLWDYGDGSTGTVPYHTYSMPGNYTVCLSIGTNLRQTTALKD